MSPEMKQSGEEKSDFEVATDMSDKVSDAPVFAVRGSVLRRIRTSTSSIPLVQIDHFAGVGSGH